MAWITYNGTKYRATELDMWELCEAAERLGMVRFIEMLTESHGLDGRTANITYIATQIGEFDFTIEDAICWLVEQAVEAHTRLIQDDKFNEAWDLVGGSV